MARPRVAPQQQRSRETYERILDVAAAIFAERGYAGTTTNKVAEGAGISIGTLYHYVPDKDALLYALAERHLSSENAALMETFTRLRTDRPGLEGSLRATIGTLVRMHVEEHHLHHLLYVSAPRSTELQQRLFEGDALFAEEVCWHLERLGIAPAQRDLVANLLVVGIEAQVHRVLIDAPEPADPDVLTEVLTQLYTRALQVN